MRTTRLGGHFGGINVVHASDVMITNNIIHDDVGGAETDGIHLGKAVNGFLIGNNLIRNEGARTTNGIGIALEGPGLARGYVGGNVIIGDARTMAKGIAGTVGVGVAFGANSISSTIGAAYDVAWAADTLLPPGLTSAFATLPVAGSAGRSVFCTDCRKAGEPAGHGTGMFVFDDGHSQWVSFAGTVAVN